MTTPPPITANQLERLVSVERFASFRRETSHPDAAVALYTWNAKVSGAYGELLQHVEVFVRNAMHRQLTELHSRARGRASTQAWFDEPSWAKHHWLDEHAKKQIRKATSRAGHRPNSPNPGKVIAALGFGFWRHLARPRYEQSFWVPALDNAFATPGACPSTRRDAVEHRLAFLHILRNRISHCEPIIHPIRYRHRGHPRTSKTLTGLYTDAIELVSFISADAAHWLTHETRGLQRLLQARTP